MLLWKLILGNRRANSQSCPGSNSLFVFSRLSNQLIELASGHFQLVRMRVNPVCKGSVLFCCPSALKLRTIAALPIEIKVERVLQLGELGCAHGLRGENCGNKNHTIRLRQHQVAGNAPLHDRCEWAN